MHRMRNYRNYGSHPRNFRCVFDACGLETEGNSSSSSSNPAAIPGTAACRATRWSTARRRWSS